MRFRWLAALAVALFSSGLASAQPKAAEPTVEVRLRSVNDLVNKFEYVAGLAGKEDVVGQVRDLIKVLSADGKGIEGIDPKKPIGAYATLEKDITISPVVILIPIADEKTFLNALGKYNLTRELGEDGTHKVAVPIPGVESLHLRFANGYVYISQKASDLNPKTLVTPKAYFATDDGSVASLLVHLDRVPADLKTFLVGQIELGIADERKKNADTESAAEKQLKNLVLDSLLSGVKGLSDDGKFLSVKAFADDKTDDLSAEVTLTAKSGSATAKNFTGLAGKTSLPAGIVATTGAAARANVKVAVTDGTKKEFAAAIDALLADAVKNAPNDQQDALKALVAAVGPTLKAGELDAAASLAGPDAKGHYQLLAALAVKDGKGIEKFVKKIDEDYGAFIGEFITFKFDVETIGDFALHRIDVKGADEKFEKLFGTKTVWLATSDKHLALSIEPDGKAIRAGLKAKAIAAPVASGELAAAKLLPLFESNLKPDELKALLKDAFGDGPTTGKDTVSLSVEGGDKLTLRFKVKGKALRLGAGLELLKGK